MSLSRYAYRRCFASRRYLGFTMSPEHIDLHRMVDLLDPDQVRALRAVAQQLLRSGWTPRPPDSLGPIRPVACCCSRAGRPGALARA